MSSVLHRNYHRPPPMASGASGSTIIDGGTDRTIDLSAGAGVACLGHSANLIKATMIEQLHMLPYVHSASYTCDAVERAAQSLLSHMSPDFKRGKVVFYSGGAEAIEAACKIAMQILLMKHGPNAIPVFVGRKQSYHGNTMFTLALGDHRRRNILGMQYSFDAGGFCKFAAFAPHLDKLGAADAVRVMAVSLDDLNDTLDNMKRLGHPCIVVVEPIGGTAAGIAPAVSEYLHKLAAMVHEFDGVLIYDEILSGNYRTGKLNAYQYYDGAEDHMGAEHPDIVVMGKGITGGYFPVSAVAVSSVMSNLLQGVSGGRLWHTTTNQNNPIGCAAVFAAMSLYYQAASQITELNRLCVDAMSKLANMSHVRSVQGVGSLWGVNFDGAASNADDIKRHMNDHGVSVYTDGGFLKGCGSMLLFAPPIGTPESAIDHAVRAIGSLHLTPTTHARPAGALAGGSDGPAMGA